jgi:hypothetical protein
MMARKQSRDPLERLDTPLLFDLSTVATPRWLCVFGGSGSCQRHGRASYGERAIYDDSVEIPVRCLTCGSGGHESASRAEMDHISAEAHASRLTVGAA